MKSVDKSVEDASYPTTASRELSHTKPSFAADADRGPGERAFYWFGKNVVGKRPWLVLLVVAALFAALTTGLFVASKTDTDLFGSLVLRPGSRVDRESKNTHRKLVEGYESGSEATNARATRGGKNMLTRKNMKQAIAFYRKKNVNDVSVTHGGVTYESKDMLLHSPGQSGLLQPVRFTTLDCFHRRDRDGQGSDDPRTVPESRFSRGLSGEPTSPSLVPTPRHSRKMMRDGFSYDFIWL